MEEIWKDIKGFEGLYQISSKGRVKRLPYVNNLCRLTKERILKPWSQGTGYLEVSLCKNNKRIVRTVHRLVAEAFCENPENKPQVDHINGDRADNRAINLRWSTEKENMNNPVTVKRVKYVCSKRRGVENGKAKPIYQYNLSGEFIKEYRNAKLAGEMNNMSVTSIRSALDGNSKSSGGYMWKYACSVEDKAQVLESYSINRTCIEVCQLSTENELLHIYPSIKEASLNTGANQAHISDCCHNKRKKCGGYKWIFKYQYDNK